MSLGSIFERFVGAIVLLVVSANLATAQQSVSGDEATQGLIPQHLLGLVHAPEVHEELNLSPGQVKNLEALFTKIDGEWFRARNLQPDKQFTRVAKIEATVRQWFRINANTAQQKRIKQLVYRAQGMRMLLRSDLSHELGLEPEQTSKLISLAKSVNDATTKLRTATMKNEVTDAMKTAVMTASKQEQDALKSVIKPEQLQKLSPILGEPFDTAKLSRIYPMAPELVPVQNWINSNPLTLQELRGKVVILHFYAFQCYNCHANFDHYRKWHEKYGEEVVVLGIQTPETPSERDPDSVRDAAKERKLDFPILVDLKSENWKTWSNTMWPTVYVIDKNGYIRQWWQGELNWKGATGDQTIENIVAKLLKEEVSS